MRICEKNNENKKNIKFKILSSTYLTPIASVLFVRIQDITGLSYDGSGDASVMLAKCRIQK